MAAPRFSPASPSTPSRSSLLSAVCCLLSAVCCLLSAICYLLSIICCLLSAVYYLLSAIYCLLFSCLLSSVCSHLSSPVDSCPLCSHLLRRKCKPSATTCKRARTRYVDEYTSTQYMNAMLTQFSQCSDSVGPVSLLCWYQRGGPILHYKAR
jgi:hypothetical protein